LRRSLNPETRSIAKPGKAEPFRKTGRRSRWKRRMIVRAEILDLKFGKLKPRLEG
jgi:hypothetical protein